MNYFGIGFAAIAALTVGALDYAAHAPKGEGATGGYIASIESRIGSLLAKGLEDAPPEALASAHLPPAPEGWESRAFTLGKTGKLAHDDMEEIEGALLTSFDDSPLFSALNEGVATSENARAAREVIEYISPGARIRLGAAHAERSGKVFREKLMRDPKSMNVKLSFGAPEVFGMVQGVMFYVSNRDEFDSTPVIPGSKPLFLRGYIGDDIRITVYAQAPAEALVGLLNAIDYDALNAMQKRPAAGVGSSFPEMTAGQERLLVARAQQLLGQQGDAIPAVAVDAARAAPSPASAPKADVPKRLSLSGSGCSTGTFCSAKQ